MTGRVWGVGLGPGAPDLLTLRAARCLGAVDTVCYIAAAGRPSRARAIADEHLRDGVAEIALPIAMDYQRDDAERRYREAAGQLAAHTRAGQDVAVLCEGDPLFYASFGYLREQLGADVPVEVIPGLGAVSAASARVGQPLTRQADRFVTITGASSDAAIAATLATNEAVAILKAGPRRARLANLLTAAGRGAQAVYLEQVSTPAETVHHGVAALPAGAGHYFALFLVYPEAVA